MAVKNRKFELVSLYDDQRHFGRVCVLILRISLSQTQPRTGLAREYNLPSWIESRSLNLAISLLVVQVIWVFLPTQTGGQLML